MVITDIWFVIRSPRSLVAIRLNPTTIRTEAPEGMDYWSANHWDGGPPPRIGEAVHTTRAHGNGESTRCIRIVSRFHIIARAACARVADLVAVRWLQPSIVVGVMGARSRRRVEGGGGGRWIDAAFVGGSVQLVWFERMAKGKRKSVERGDYSHDEKAVG